MSYSVRFAPEAVEQLKALQVYLADAVSPVLAAEYVDSILGQCEELATFPLRGAVRDDIRPGLRAMGYRKRAVIAFQVDDDSKQVTVLGVFYGGQDYESMLGGDGPG